MCEILVRVKDSPLTGDPVFDSKVTRAGDVIHVAPDGWPWGDRELSHDFWRIVKLPNVTESAARVLLGAEMATDPKAPNRTLQTRLNGFVLNHPLYPAAFRAFMADDGRKAGAMTLDAVGKTINFAAVFRKKAAIPDPAALA